MIYKNLIENVSWYGKVEVKKETSSCHLLAKPDLTVGWSELECPVKYFLDFKGMLQKRNVSCLNTNLCQWCVEMIILDVLS